MEREGPDRYNPFRMHHVDISLCCCSEQVVTSEPRHGREQEEEEYKVQEQHDIATNTTSSHGVSTAVSFDSPRRGAPSGSVGKSYSGKTGSGNKGKGKELVRERTVYTHFTNATDTNPLRVVIVAVCEYVGFGFVTGY
jgi:hypothetical protein